MRLSILYRGPLSSCNYDCHYCPFAKHHETAAELADDRRKLRRFVDWVRDRPGSDEIRVFFTPWGEALTRRWYQEAMAELSHLSPVSRIAVQTNLSCRLTWLTDCRVDRIGLWCTYHPSQTTISAFVAQCRRLDHIGAPYSVGVVGLKENFADIEALRREIPPEVYLWINAYKDSEDYYSEREVVRLERIDPLFRINNTRYASFGKICHTGEHVVSIDGDGDVRRCHFIQKVLGNIYRQDIQSMLRPRKCTNATCGCHIGYVHLEDLQLDAVFGEGVLERIPAGMIWHGSAITPARETLADSHSL